MKVKQKSSSSGSQTKDPLKVSEGKKFRLAGARFERKVRADLESKGWIVDRWSNNVERAEKAFQKRLKRVKLIWKDKSTDDRLKNNLT